MDYILKHLTDVYSVFIDMPYDVLIPVRFQFSGKLKHA